MSHEPYSKHEILWIEISENKNDSWDDISGKVLEEFLSQRQKSIKILPTMIKPPVKGNHLQSVEIQQ